MSKMIDLSNAERVGKSYLIDYLVANADLDRKQATRAVNGTLDAIVAALVSDTNVSLSNVGTLRRETAGATVRRNPATGGTIDVEAKEVVRWTPAPALLEAVNGNSTRTSLSVKAPKGTFS